MKKSGLKPPLVKLLGASWRHLGSQSGASPPSPALKQKECFVDAVDFFFNFVGAGKNILRKAAF